MNEDGTDKPTLREGFSPPPLDYDTRHRQSDHRREDRVHGTSVFSGLVAGTATTTVACWIFFLVMFVADKFGLLSDKSGMIITASLAWPTGTFILDLVFKSLICIAASRRSARYRDIWLGVGLSFFTSWPSCIGIGWCVLKAMHHPHRY